MFQDELVHKTLQLTAASWAAGTGMPAASQLQITIPGSAAGLETTGKLLRRKFSQISL